MPKRAVFVGNLVGILTRTPPARPEPGGQGNDAVGSPYLFKAVGFEIQGENPADYFEGLSGDPT